MRPSRCLPLRPNNEGDPALLEQPGSWTNRKGFDMHDSSLIERFWAKVDKNGPIPAARPDLGRCWQWTASTARGYGKIWSSGPKTSPDKFLWLAHRLSYDMAFGLPSDPSLVIDHLCRNPRCVNPMHLEPVTVRENTLRGDSPMARQARRTHCIRGHAFTNENTYIWVGQPNMRKCRTCRSEYARSVKVAA